MASEEEVVLGGDGKGVAHESSGVNDESTGHGAGDTRMKLLVRSLSLNPE